MLLQPTVIVIWGSKYLILMLEICMVEGSLKVHVLFLKYRTAYKQNEDTLQKNVQLL